MNIEELNQVNFYLSLTYVTIIAAISTIIIMQLYKLILKKRKIITKDTNPDKKDNILTKAGRIIAITLYSLIYLLNQIYLNHKIVVNETLIIGLLSGGTITLTLAKGLYTSLRQHQKKQNIYDQLIIAKKQLESLQTQTPNKQNKITLKRKEEQ